MKAVIGPGIGPDSFQVGEEVATQFKKPTFLWITSGPSMAQAMEPPCREAIISTFSMQTAGYWSRQESMRKTFRSAG